MGNSITQNKMKKVTMMQKAILAHERKTAARKKARQVAEKLKEMKLSSTVILNNLLMPKNILLMYVAVYAF